MQDRHRQVSPANPACRARVGRDPRPRLARIVTAVDSRGATVAARAGLLVAGNRREEPLGICRRDGHVRLDDGRKPVGQRFPRRATVDRLEDAAIGAGPNRIFPRPLPLFPHGGVDRIGIGWIDVDVVATGVLVLREHLLKRLSAIGRAIDAALLIRSVGMSQRGHEEPVGILGIDGDARNLLRIAQSEVHPRPASVDRLVDAVARRKVGPVKPLATPDVDHVGVGGRDGDGANGSCRLVVENRLPDPSGVRRLPHASVDRRHIEGVGVACMSSRGPGPARAMRTDVPPLQIGEQPGTDLRSLLGRNRGSEGRDTQGQDDDGANHLLAHCRDYLWAHLLLQGTSWSCTDLVSPTTTSVIVSGVRY